MSEDKLKALDGVVRRIVEKWYERVREFYVTEEDGQELGVEPELKCFHEKGNHRIKFARKNELDVTYGVAVENRQDTLFIVSSVNNKSANFDYDRFVDRLKTHYWRSRNEKPWTDPDFDHFAYGDLLYFEPSIHQSVSLDVRKDKADIVSLHFAINPKHEAILFEKEQLLQDLIENYVLYPLQRIYAEAYRAQ